MKKIFYSVLLLTAFLAGCSDNKEETEDINTAPEISETTEEEDSEATTDEEEQENNEEEETTEKEEDKEEEMEDEEAVSDEEINEADKVDDFADADELSKQDYFDPEDYEGRLITDNPGTRIFIFREGEKQVYKTIFIKNDQRLKVIDLMNNELLMNERIN